MRVELAASDQSVSAPPGASWLWPGPRGIAALILMWILSRWIFDSMWNLVPDEAYYWVWSRHWALSYLDHPPMVAWMIRLGTLVMDNTELGVRWVSGFMMAGTVGIVAFVARGIVGDKEDTLTSAPSPALPRDTGGGGKEEEGEATSRAWGFAPVALLVSPMIAVAGSIATPDTPACFFQAAALAVVLRVFDEPRRAARRWVMFGILFGLALDSKYTSVLLGLAVFLAMIFSAEGRRSLRTPWPWVAAVISIAVFSPVIYWNAQHDWASFRFQLRHGTSGNEATPVLNLANYVGSQMVVCTPVLFGLCVWVIGVYWQRFAKRPPPLLPILGTSLRSASKEPGDLRSALPGAGERGGGNSMSVLILLFAATTPLVFFGISAVRRHVEGNWPMFAYVPGVLLISKYLGESWERPRVFWAELALIVALVMTVVMHAPALVWKVAPSISTPQWDHLYGWSELARNGVEPMRQDSPIFGADYEYASELSFYLPDKPQVWPLADQTRKTAFDFFGGQSDPQSYARVVLVRRISKGFDTVTTWPALGPGYGYSMLSDFQQFKNGREIRRSLVEVAQRKTQ